MARHPVGQRGVRPVASVLAAVLLAGCGGGGTNDGAKVEAGLRHYLGTVTPEGSAFPVGAGIPKVKDGGCHDRHVKAKEGEVLPSPHLGPKIPAGLGLWSCVVEFGRTAFTVAVAANAGGQVSWAAPVSRQALPPATVYQGGS